MKSAASDSPSSPSVAVIEGKESEFVRVRKRSWARLIARTWLEDPSLCPLAFGVKGRGQLPDQP